MSAVGPLLGPLSVKSTDISAELYRVCSEIMIDLIYLSREYIYSKSGHRTARMIDVDLCE